MVFAVFFAQSIQEDVYFPYVTKNYYNYKYKY